MKRLALVAAVLVLAACTAKKDEAATADKDDDREVHQGGRQTNGTGARGHQLLLSRAAGKR